MVRALLVSSLACWAPATALVTPAPAWGVRSYSAAPSGGRLPLQCLTKLPGGDDPYVQIKKQAVEAAQSAIKAGITQIELEFPPVKGKLDVSLGETLDANRAFARELARPFAARMGQKLWVIFPDGGEANLAKKTWGKTTFTVASIESSIRDGKDLLCDMQIVVNPGFNINEWIDLDKLYRPGVPMVLLNGGLDKVRGGYYPAIFYPGLAAAKKRFLANFQSAYYLKAMPGGWLFRKHPEDWQVLLAGARVGGGGRGRGAAVGVAQVLETSGERPEYNRAAGLVKAAEFESQRRAAEAAAEEGWP